MMTAHPTIDRGQRLAPADWDGISHGRMTRLMTQARLPASARIILAEIVRVIPVGQWRHISHATLHRRLHLSESTVSQGMALLAGELLDEEGLPINPTPFIARRRREGRPGYEICPLPPPELRRPAGRPATPQPGADETPVLAVQMRMDALFSPPSADPVDPIPPQGVLMPQNGIGEGSPTDPPILLDHACSGSSMRDDHPDEPQPPSPATAEPPSPGPAGGNLPPAILAELGLLAHQWRALEAVAPAGYGPRECAQDLLKLRSRPDVRSPYAVLRQSLATGDPIYSLAELAALAGGPTRTEAPDGGGDHAPDGGGGAGPRGGARPRAQGRGGRGVPDRAEPAAAADRAGGSAPPHGERDAPPLTPERIAELRAATRARMERHRQTMC